MFSSLIVNEVDGLRFNQFRGCFLKAFENAQETISIRLTEVIHGC